MRSLGAGPEKFDIAHIGIVHRTGFWNRRDQRRHRSARRIAARL